VSDGHPFSTIASTVAADSVLSPDGSRLFVTGSDGNLRVYDAATGALLATWDVGTQLGAVDISADGSFLMVAERVPVSVVGSGTPPQSQTITTYKVSTADGSVQSFPVQVSGSSGPAHDVAILANGEVVLTMAHNGYGLWSLDTSTGTYTGLAAGNEAGALTTSVDRTYALLAPTNSSGAPLEIYEQGVGITATGSRGDSGGPSGGFNFGIQAISDAAGLVVQGPGLSVFNLDLDWQFDLTAIEAEVGTSVGFAFDGTGDNLYILSQDHDEILQVSTDSWTIVRRFYVGTDAEGPIPGFGNRLLLSEDGTFFSVITGSGVQRVDNFPLAAVSGSAGNDSLSGTDAAEAINGLAGDDNLSGGGGHDSIYGGDGDDIISGGLGDDFLYGGSGNDVFVGGAGIDSIYGGAGVDRVDYSADTNPLGLLVNLSSDVYMSGFGHPDEVVVGPGEALDDSGNRDRISGVENVKTGDFNDWIVGSADANRIESGAGNDLVQGGAGDDELIGGTGSDTLTGGAGNDILDGGQGSDFLDGSAGADRMTGGTGNDVYVVDNAGDVVIENPGEGTDRIRTGQAAYSLADLFNVENLTGTNAAGQTLTGNGSANAITGAAGNDVIDGGIGADTMTGGAGSDLYFVDNAGDLVVELPGASEGVDEIRAAVAVYSIVNTAVEGLVANSNINHDFRGNSGNNTIIGGTGSDVLRLYDGGNDTVIAGAGNDNIFFIASLTAADVVNGGEGTDTLVLQGPYGSLTLTSNITQIENISLLGGGNTNFGDPGTNLYDYVLTTNDANFAAGVQARINGAALLVGEDFTFNGSAETDAKFVVYGGKGQDTLIGGFGADIFIFAEDRFSPGDTVNGGPGGYDGIFFRGNYTIDFNAPGYNGLMTSIENMTLTSITDERYARGGDPAGFDYNITLADNQLLAGVELTVSGTFLQSYETMIVDGSRESDATFRFFAGRSDDTLKGGANNDLLFGNLGADTLTGNGGADTFRYDSTAESTSTSLDHILDFTPGTDKIDLTRIDANTLVGGDQAFAWIGSNAFSGTAGELHAFQSGGSWILEGDTNGDGVGDLVISLTLQGPTPLGAGDFLP
jgi:Ca2+-binding RTX toxin-like protein